MNLNCLFPFRRPNFDNRGGLTNGLPFLFFAVAYWEWDDVIRVKVTWWSLLVSPSSLVSSTGGLIPTDDDIIGFVILARAINDTDAGLGYRCDTEDGYNCIKVSWRGR